MFDVITIGSAFQDVYVFSKKFKVLKDSRVATGMVETFTFGTKIELDDILFEIGGGATNAASTLTKQGLSVGCLSRVGNDGAGTEVKKFLNSNKIGNLLIIDKKNRTAHSVVFLGKNGERTLLVYRGAAHAFQTKEINLNKIKNTRWFYISSLAGNLALLEKIVNFAKKNGIKVVLNPGRLEIKNRKKLAKILKKVDILLLNRLEAIDLNKRAYNDLKGIINDVYRMCPNISLVTMGDQGLVYCQAGNFFRVKVKAVKGVDTTGAGDAFGSGFLAGYLKYKGDVQKAIKLAANNSASVVKIIGAKHGLLRKNDKLNRTKVAFSKIR